MDCQRSLSENVAAGELKLYIVVHPNSGPPGWYQHHRRATLSLTHEQCEAAEPRYVDGVPKTRLMNIGGGLTLQITPPQELNLPC
jgi:hypothetical protein